MTSNTDLRSVGDEPRPQHAVECRGLRKAYDPVVALERIDLVVSPGERIAVFGANGAGKTTLIKLVAGLVRPSGGVVRVFGRRPYGSPGTIRSRIGLVSHQSYLYEDRTANENLRFFSRLYGVPDAARRTQEMLAIFGLEHRSRDPVRILSRGLQQRVALARAMVHAPELLLLDEPDTGLDPSAREALSTMMRNVKTLTALVATHNVDMGLSLCGRAIVLEAGAIVYDSGPSTQGDRGEILDLLLSRNEMGR
ncbi:MAG: ABC transporter ATP-binding protein [Chloroflexi bacterium]|nr:ABC transporter ATP-binding protein [Chloroflexota bacterium]